jgi:membrane-bound metal-dependent hydrolase YbcI (DUF457 family)
MGTQHAMTGTLAGMGAAAALPMAPTPVRALVVIVFGGAALLPDLDHPSATAARSLGLVTRAIAYGMDRLSLQIYHATAGPKDPRDRASGHRLFTHTPVACVLAGAITGLIALAYPPAAALVCALLGGLLTLPLSRFFRFVAASTRLALRVTVTAVAPGVGRDLERFVRDLNQAVGWLFFLAGGGLGWWVLTTMPVWAWTIPVAVTLGCLVHIAGDLVTNSGVPILWCPLVGTHRERRWAPVRTFSFFDAGGPEELGIIRWVLLGANLLAALALLGLLVPLWTAIMGWVN